MTETSKNLMLIPGMLCNRLMWEPQIKALSDGVDIVVANIAGQSDIPSIASEVLKDAPSSFVVAGLSMGGYVALELFRQAPERVEKLALLNTNAHAADPVNEIPSCQGMLGRLRAGDPVTDLAADLPAVFFSEQRQGDDALAKIVAQMASDIGAQGLERQISAVISRQDSMSLLPKIDCPTLVLGAQQDMLTPPKEHEEIAALISQANLVILEQCGHLSTLEKPDEVSASLREWLESG